MEETSMRLDAVTARNQTMKVLRLGIASIVAFQARTIAIAKGMRTRLGEPKLWFSSAQSIGKLIDDNWPLLQEIRRHPPQSITELLPEPDAACPIYRGR
jgi:predicted transcriptional regulator